MPRGEALKHPVDAEGREYAPGQQVAYPYLSGCIPIVERRTVVAVEDGRVWISPSMGARIPEPMRRPWRSLIV